MTSGAGVIEEFLQLNGTWEILLASLAMALFIAVAVTSIRAARRRISHETWYGIHLYVYVAIALAFTHEITLGSDLVADPVALAYWIGLYVATFGLLLWFRVLTPFIVSARHRLRVAAVVPEASGVVSIYLTGRDLDRLAVRAGQFFHIRFLRGGDWWRPHPFSLSAVPNGDYLRVTVKDLGDDTHRMMSMPVGTHVFIEGPYGAFTADVISRPDVVMLAGGAGVTPLRAIFEDLVPGHQQVTFLYREGDPGQTIFRDELAALAAHHQADVRLLEGHRGTPEMPIDPLATGWLSTLVPAIGEADILVCGSPPFTRRVLDSLRDLGVPSERIHAERFGD